MMDRDRKTGLHLAKTGGGSAETEAERYRAHRISRRAEEFGALKKANMETPKITDEMRQKPR